MPELSEYKIDLPLQNPAVHPGHPFKNPASHEYLLGYLRERLNAGKLVRDNDISRYVSIDKHVAGWMRLSPEDRKRAAAEETKGTPQARMLNLPLTFVHIDDMMTYYAATFAPNRGMFYATVKPDEQKAADQVVTLMNNHAIYSGYFRETLLTIYNILKYNHGGMYTGWSIDMGPKLTTSADNSLAVQESEVWAGNKAEALDVYNTFHDPFVHPTRVHCDGEWCARACVKSRYEIQQKGFRGQYFNLKTALDNATPSTSAYYRNPPVEAQMHVDQSVDGKTNWVSILSMTEGYAQVSGFELVEVFIRLNPFQLNLIPKTSQNKSTRNKLEIWRITLLNDMYIVDATPLNNIHGYLPMFFASLNDDLMDKAAKSVSEVIKPLQNFASFLLNTHIAATRKNIWGLTVYDPSVVDLSQIAEGEVSAKIPTKPMGAGKKVADYIWEHSNKLETTQTMQDLESTMGIINQFFPTQSLPSQIAGIDRAVDSQVSAVQNGANRRMQKGARLMDDLLFRPMRSAMYYNILQYQGQGKVSDYYGNTVTVDLESLRQTDMPYIIGQGLKAIDRMGIASHMQEIIFAMIQAPAAGQQYDIGKMINFWGNLIDMDIDMDQFRIQAAPATNVDAQGNPIGQGTDAAPPGNAIQPATNPDNVTGPIYG